MKLPVLFRSRSFAALALVASGLSLVQNVSAASTPGPVVIPGGAVTTPYVITTPGTYVLGGNRTMNDVSKHAIEIKAPDVTLDLGGFTLAHGAPAVGAGTLVYIPATENVEIRNGTLSNAAKQGIGAFAGKGLRVIGVRIVSADTAGILTTVPNTLIDKCHVADTKDGIAAVGLGTLVTDCTVSGCSIAGVSIAHGSRIVRSVVNACVTGMNLTAYSTASDCSVSGSTSRGIYASGSTLRNVDLSANAVGVQCSAETMVVIAASRITNNTTNIQGIYTNGGLNVIQ